jgi:hypothetical protein
MSRIYRRHPEEKWRELNELFEASNESQKKFCERHEIGIAAFRYWRGKFRKVSREEPFRELFPALMNMKVEYKIELHNGRKLCVEGGFSDKELRRLLGVLESC